MPQPTPSTAHDVVIVTTAAKLAALIDDAVDQAVRRAVSDVLAERPMVTKWLTVREATRAYRKSRSTLYRWRLEGRIEARVIGSSLYYEAPE